LGRKRKFKECKGSNRRIQEGISARHKRCGMVRTQGRNIQKGRITREIHSKEIIWMVRQKVQSRILEKIGKKLETVERETIKGKKNGNNYRRRRN